MEENFSIHINMQKNYVINFWQKYLREFHIKIKYKIK